MYYISTDKDSLKAYNDKVAVGENYNGSTTTQWAEVIEHHEGGSYAILKHPAYSQIEGVDENGDPLDTPTVEDISDFYSPINLALQ